MGEINKRKVTLTNPDPGIVINESGIPFGKFDHRIDYEPCEVLDDKSCEVGTHKYSKKTAIPAMNNQRQGYQERPHDEE